MGLEIFIKFISFSIFFLRSIKCMSTQFSISVPIDHFNSTEAEKFNVRYWIDDIHFSNSNGKCVLLFICGGESTGSGVSYPFVRDYLAPLMDAAVIQMEHRFYGASVPERNALDFLTVEQSLADHAALISHLRDTFGQSCVVGVFGGSYPGFLAAMMRLRYPSIVDFSHASSAPLLFYSQEADADGYYRIVSAAAEKVAPGCAKAVKLATERLWEMPVDILVQELRICPESFDFPRGLAHEELTQVVRVHFANLNMANYPPTGSGLQKICQILIQDPWPQTLFSDIRKRQYNNEEAICLNLTAMRPAGAQLMSCADMSGCGSGMDGKMWDWQTCTELIEQISTSETDYMFTGGREWSLQWLKTYCAERFPKATPPRPEYLVQLWGFDSSQLKHKTSRIIFVNGMQDGWSAGSVTHELSSKLPVINIPSGAHHSEMKAPSESDTVDMKEARKTIGQILLNWVEEAHNTRTRKEQIAFK